MRKFNTLEDNPYIEYEGKVINGWKLLCFSKTVNKNTYYHALCLHCKKLFEPRIQQVILCGSKCCKKCSYKIREIN
jgi:hypothetical protein